MRFLTPELIDETLADGKDCERVEAGRGKLRRRKTFDGVDVVLVLPEDQPLIVTGWTEVSDIATALASERWSQTILEKIQAFERFEHKTPFGTDPIEKENSQPQR